MFNRNKATKSKIMPNMSCRIRHVEHIEYTSNNIVLDYFQGLICCIEQRKDFVRVFDGDSNLFNLSRPDTGRKERINLYFYFHTSMHEGLEGTTKKCENQNLGTRSFFTVTKQRFSTINHYLAV